MLRKCFFYTKIAQKVVVAVKSHLQGKDVLMRCPESSEVCTHTARPVQPAGKRFHWNLTDPDGLLHNEQPADTHSRQNQPHSFSSQHVCSPDLTKFCPTLWRTACSQQPELQPKPFALAFISILRY